MSVRVLPVNPALPRPQRLDAAVRALERGGVVALPTETFYGLAADSRNARAVASVNALKGKDADSPCLLLLADSEQVEHVARDLPALFGPLAERFWPGPLTLVVPAREDLPPAIGGGRGTVGVRVPGLALPRQVARSLGRPITGVSANVTGEAPCRTAAEVALAFPAGLALVLDGGPAPGGRPSTVLDLCCDPPRILREGTLPRVALEPLLPGLR